MVKTGQRHQGIKAVWRVKPPIPFGGSLKWLVAALLLTGCADSEQVSTKHLRLETVLTSEPATKSVDFRQPGDVINDPGWAAYVQKRPIARGGRRHDPW